MTAEPWSAWELRVGDRVRVRLSGECQSFHSPSEDGMLGVIANGERRGEIDGHAVPVSPLTRLLWRFDGGNHPHSVYWFAAIELEPADWNPDAGSNAPGAVTRDRTR